MKVALCISGQIRSVRESFNDIYNNIILPNNADVFIHAWYDEDTLDTTSIDFSRNRKLEKGIDKHIIELYKPKKVLFEKQKIFNKTYNHLYVSDSWKEAGLLNIGKNKATLEDSKNNIIQCSLSMWYSIFKCNELKELYAIENNFLYDYVIRSRFDIAIKEPLYVHKYDKKALYYIDINQPDNLVSDIFNFGSNRIMNLYASMYYQVELLNSYDYIDKNKRQVMTYRSGKDGMWGNEYMLRDLFYLYNIPVISFKSHYHIIY